MFKKLLKITVLLVSISFMEGAIIRTSPAETTAPEAKDKGKTETAEEVSDLSGIKATVGPFISNVVDHNYVEIKGKIGRGQQDQLSRSLGVLVHLPFGTGLLTSCDPDMEDLSKRTLLIDSLTLMPEMDLQVNQTITVEATVNYSGDATELTYNWNVEEGEIHPKGSGTLVQDESNNRVAKATYAAPNKKGTYTIEFTVCNGAVTAGDKVHVKVGDNSDTVMPSVTPNTTP